MDRLREGADLLLFTHQDHKLHARLLVFGLLVNCPFKRSSSPECPLGELRRLSLEKKMQFAEGLSEQDVEKILKYHANCRERRLQPRRGITSSLNQQSQS